MGRTLAIREKNVPVRFYSRKLPRASAGETWITERNDRYFQLSRNFNVPRSITSDVVTTGTCSGNTPLNGPFPHLERHKFLRGEVATTL